MSETEILIQNRMARIVSPTFTDFRADPQNPGKQIGTIRSITIKPGINRVERVSWGRVRETDLIKHHVENELLVELDDNTELNAMSVTRAIPIVKNTFDKAMLRSWKKTESRKPVRDAIDAQLEQLDGSKPESEEDELKPIREPDRLSPQSPMQLPGAPDDGGVDVTRPRRGRPRRKS